MKSRKSIKALELVGEEFNEQNFELTTLNWYPNDDTMNPGSKRMYEMIDITNMSGWRFLSQQFASIGQYLGKSALRYRGYTDPERSTCNWGTIASSGSRKSYGEQFFESSINVCNLLNVNWLQDNDIDFDYNLFPRAFNGINAKTTTKLLKEYDGQGWIYWGDAS